MVRAGVGRRVVAPPRDRQVAPHTETAAGIRHRRRVASVREEMRVGARGVRRLEASRGQHGQ